MPRMSPWVRVWVAVGLTLSCAIAASAAPFSYAALDTVLARHVHEGQVEYGALTHDAGPLRRYLDATREAHPELWSRDEQFVFWVNTYNARVLDGVLRRPGLRSVLDVGRTLGVPTLGFFHEKRVTAGRSLSLNEIEHGILRKSFREPRVHFVLNCASTSCPVLPARALQAGTLDSTLEAATLAFLADSLRNPMASGSELRLSSIFKWYRSDFERAAGSLPGFLASHPGRRGAPDPRARVRFASYDWSLNGHW